MNAKIEQPVKTDDKKDEETERLRDYWCHIIVKTRCIASQFINTLMFRQKTGTGSQTGQLPRK